MSNSNLPKKKLATIEIGVYNLENNKIMSEGVNFENAEMNSENNVELARKNLESLAKLFKGSETAKKGELDTDI